MVPSPIATSKRAVINGSLRPSVPVNVWTAAPTDASTGTVPAQKATMIAAPQPALPVPAAINANAYSHPHGNSAVSNPMVSARGKGLSPMASRWPATKIRCRPAGTRVLGKRTPR